MVATLEKLTLLKRHAHGVTELTLNRPSALNAFSSTMYLETAAHLRALSKDTSTRIILLSGTGDTFCSGMDIKEASEVEQARVTIRAARKFMSALLDTPKIVVAAVSGAVVGIGVTLLLHCDFVFAASETTFCTPFASVGLVAEFGASVSMPIALGIRRANELLLRGATLAASELGDIVHETTGTRDDVVQKARSFAEKWSAECDAEMWGGVEDGKRMVRKEIRVAVKKAIREEMQVIEKKVASGTTARLMRGRVKQLRARL